jgi:hypothetical protein
MTKPEEGPEVEASDLKPIQIRVTDEWLDAIDNWRRKQRRIPSVAEAIRQLVPIGIEADPPPATDAVRLSPEYPLIKLQPARPIGAAGPDRVLGQER